MPQEIVYPVLLANKFEEELKNGGNVELELSESKGVLGFAWRVFVIDANGKKSMLVRKKDIEPHEIKSPNAIVAFAQKYGIENISVPVPNPKKYQLYSDGYRDRES